MDTLIYKGIVVVYGMDFHDIEGGFAPGAKAVLAKDIAAMYDCGVGEINENINNNRDRFIDGIDIINLKGTTFVYVLIDNGVLTKNSVNASKNIYLLSRNGYAILLKIKEGNLAWEKYRLFLETDYFLTQSF